MSYFKNLFVSIDQLGNTLAFGNPDNTISSRIGHYNDQINKPTPWYWIIFKHIVDTAFYPLDGKGHCHKAFHNDSGEEFDEETNNFAVAILAIIIIPICVLIGIFLYLFLLLGIIPPKKKNRIKKRIIGVRCKFNGSFNELNAFEESSDKKLEDLKLKADTIFKEIEIAIQEKYEEKKE